MNRPKRREMAEETLLILHEGRYTSPSGSTISIKDWQSDALENSTHYSPKKLEQLYYRLSPPSPEDRHDTSLEVVDQTVLEAAKAMVDAGETKVIALNFASAKNAGGGFLKGSQAQEEALARSSGLYNCQIQHNEYYDTNRQTRGGIYTDHMIYTPAVPVFREDSGALLEDPYRISIITAPAVNAGVVRRDNKQVSQIRTVMTHRTGLVLALARAHQYPVLILGAWGCGVFRNDPQVIASIFKELLVEGELFKGAFRKVLFAIPSFRKRSPNAEAFLKAFPGND